jgi:hypothetical protein
MHRFAKRLVVLAMVIHMVPSAALADWLVDGVPIPDDAKVVPPSAAPPESEQQFLGAWVGRWGGALKHILIVESVRPDRAVAPRASTASARCPLTASSPTLGVSIMFTETSGNGRRTAGTTATLAIPEMVAQEQRALAPIGWSAAVPGTAFISSSAPTFATWDAPTSGSTAGVSGWPER